MQEINSLIASAIKDGRQTELQVLRAIKTEYTKYMTARSGNVLDEQAKTNILLKLKAQREDSINQFKLANRLDLVESEKAELEIINKYAPKEASVSEIEECVSVWVAQNHHLGLSMKHMGILSTHVKSIYPTANGKTISEIYKKLI